MNYKSISVTGRGGPDMLKIIDNTLRLPLPGEVRVRVLVAPVCQDDIAARVGNRPFLPKIPFTPGYSILGIADEIGEGIDDISVGDRVAALTQCGGYSEYVYVPAKRLVRVPENLDVAEASVLMLNYLVAYQGLHRLVEAKRNDKALVIGASGGVGTAFLQLGKLAGVKMYGLASPGKHKALTDLGAIPIDYHNRDFIDIIRKSEPGGIDFVFNGMDDEYIEPGMKLLRRGGTFVHYGAPQSFSGLVRFLIKLGIYNSLPNGKTIKGYGTHRVGIDILKQDWQALFKLLGERKIEPAITARFPLLEAARANQLLESGKVTGNVVLLA